jgi:hypothetical protein
MEYREIVEIWRITHPNAKPDYEITIGPKYHSVKLVIHDNSEEDKGDN